MYTKEMRRRRAKPTKKIHSQKSQEYVSDFGPHLGLILSGGGGEAAIRRRTSLPG